MYLISVYRVCAAYIIVDSSVFIPRVAQHASLISLAWFCMIAANKGKSIKTSQVVVSCLLIRCTNHQGDKLNLPFHCFQKDKIGLWMKNNNKKGQNMSRPWWSTNKQENKTILAKQCHVLDVHTSPYLISLPPRDSCVGSAHPSPG